MSRFNKIGLTAVLVLGSAFWLVIAQHVLGVLFFLGFVASLLLRRLRARLLVPVAFWFAFIGCTWLPFDITFRVAPDGPKFVECCPGGAPYLDYKAALERERRGECKVCSDLVTGFEPRYW